MATQNETAIQLSPSDLEALIRRVVREELKRVLATPVRALVNDQMLDGPDDLQGDEMLLADALAVLQEFGESEEAWMSWDDFEAELDQADAEDELSH
jgi:hypothetical protein